MKIILYPNKILSQVAELVNVESHQYLNYVRHIAKDMFSVMIRNNGAGLAAPQVGISKRIIVWRNREDERFVGVNPIITYGHGKITTKEGCLSVPNIQRDIKRARVIEFWSHDENGERVHYDMKNMDAVIIQHEIDHLNGVTILDDTKKRKVTGLWK
ncbi:peptide deformylase [Candidatus Pacearchaeota archaeon]|nr:peptide deformylase [Candidatus Pacearchaeota archaeon]